MSLALEARPAPLNALDPRLLGRLPELADAPLAFRAAFPLVASNWTFGNLTLVTPAGRELRLEGREPGPEGRLLVHDFGFIRRALAGGDIGFAEGYMAGEWDTPDLTDLLTLCALNFHKMQHVSLGSPVMWVMNRILHAFRGNSRSGARRNIQAHYDLGNAFYGGWLDAGMTYSAARFETPGQPLQDAQTNKYRALARTMDLRPDHSVLELGCGWGGFAEFAARDVGARVTAITISKEQYEFARARIFAAGLNELAEIRLVDYRDVQGQFDRVASIEMFEAVGERYWPGYFAKVRDSLAPGGRAGLQIITIRDEFFEEYRSRADFIQKYIFPGGMLPSERRLLQETEGAGLTWTGVERFGQDYAKTLAHWSRSFDAAWDSIAALGFDERFKRLWKFYLSYCEAGFRTERTNVAQLGLAKA